MIECFTSQDRADLRHQAERARKSVALITNQFRANEFVGDTYLTRAGVKMASTQICALNLGAKSR